MSNDPEQRVTLRHADQARTEFAIIEEELEAIYARLASMPTRADLARTALGIMFCTSVLVLLGIEMPRWWALRCCST